MGSEVAVPSPPPVSPGRLGSQRRSPVTPGRAQSCTLGTGTGAGRILCCAPLYPGGAGGDLIPRFPRPAGSIRPQPPAQREIKSAIRAPAFGRLCPRAPPGGGTLGRGREGGWPRPRQPGCDQAAAARIPRPLSSPAPLGGDGDLQLLREGRERRSEPGVAGAEVATAGPGPQDRAWAERGGARETGMDRSWQLPGTRGEVEVDTDRGDWT